MAPLLRPAPDPRAARAAWPPGTRVELGTKDFQRRTLPAFLRPTVRALAEAMFPTDRAASTARLDGFVDEVDAFLSPASKTLRFGLVVMLFVLRWSPLLYGRPRRFEALPVDARVTHLERLERSRVTELPLLVVAYKTILTMLFYEDAAEHAALGYPGPERQRHKRLLPQAPAAGVAPPSIEEAP